jgi:hypothetical protein
VQLSDGRTKDEPTNAKDVHGKKARRKRTDANAQKPFSGQFVQWKNQKQDIRIEPG